MVDHVDPVQAGTAALPPVGRAISVAVMVCCAVLSGCVAQQADLKQTERALQQRIKQQDDQFSQTRARQSQEISTLREQDLPQLRGELEKALHQAQELQSKQEDLRHRSAQLEQQTKKLEQLAAKMDADSTTRYAWVQKSLDNQDAKVSARLDEITKAMETAMAGLKKDLVEVVQRTNEGLAKRVEVRLDEQQKGMTESQQKLEQVSQKFAQFNQALTGFKEALTGVNDRVGQNEQASKALVTRIDSDAKTAAAHATEVNKSVASVAKALESVGQKVTARLDEQDKRIDAVAQKVAARFDEQDRRTESLTQFAQKVTARFEEQDRRIESIAQFAQKVTARFEEQDRRIDLLAKAVDRVSQKSGSRQQTGKQAQRSAQPPTHHPSGRAEPADPEPNPMPAESAEPEHKSATITAPPDPPAVESAGSQAEPSDKTRYERVLAMFRGGDLPGARQGFVEFLSEFPNSDLAPNARYWLGETYYGTKDFRKAIDAYDKVELDYPGSEKVPAAMLKKGYAYLALNDKKRASSAFKQVVTLYPKSPEAGKASDKLAQLKEVR